MKLIASSVVLVLALTACDRRDAQPVEPSTTTDTATADAAAATPAGDTTVVAPDTMPATPPNPTGACEGLTGQAQTDCLNNAGPNGTVSPGSTPPQFENTTPSTPPAGTTEAPPADAGAAPPPQT